MRWPPHAYRPTLTRNSDSIIFVHGLGSNPDTTWRAEKTATKPEHERSPPDSVTSSKEYVCWVTDFLPQDIRSVAPEDVRVFFYNHDSFWQRDAVQTRLWSLGHNMFSRISIEIRRTEEVSKRKVLKRKAGQLITTLLQERGRDLIFVGYSYGGLVVKQVRATAPSRRGWAVTYQPKLSLCRAVQLIALGPYPVQQESIICRHQRTYKGRLLPRHSPPGLGLK